MVRRLLAAFLAAACSLSSVSAASAADEPLELITGDAAFVLRLKALDPALDRWAGLIESTIPAAPERDMLIDLLRKEITESLGKIIGNPALVGADRKADWWLAVYTSPRGEELYLTFFIPARDAAEMGRALDSQVGRLPHRSWLIYSAFPAAIETTRRRIAGEGEPFSKRVDAESRALFDREDLSVFINVPRLREIGVLGFAGLAAEEQALAADGRQTAADQLLTLLTNPAPAWRQALEDATLATFGCSLSRDGARAEILARVAAGSPSDRVLTAFRGSAFPAMAGLPAGGTIYFGARGGGLVPLLTAPASLNVFSEKDTQNEIDLIQAEAAGWHAFEFGDLVWSLGNGSIDQGLMPLAVITEVSAPQKARDSVRKIYQAGLAPHRLNYADMKPAFRLESDTVHLHLGVEKADVVKCAFQTEDAEGDEKQTRAVFDALLRVAGGPGGLATHLLPRNDRLIETTGGGVRMLHGVLGAIDGKMSRAENDESFRATRARLAETANVMLLVDVPRLLLQALTFSVRAPQVVIDERVVPGHDNEMRGLTGELWDMLAQLAPSPIDDLFHAVGENAPALARQSAELEAKFGASYAGLSLGAEPRGLRLKAVLPAGHVRAALVLFEILAGHGHEAATNADAEGEGPAAEETDDDDDP